MEDLGVTASVSMSTENVERAFDRVGDKAAQMANKVAKEAEKAGAATDNMGAGAEKSAEKFTRAESRMRSAIQKSTRELEMLGKTASQKFEAQLEFKGLDKAKFQPFLDELRKAEEATKKAESGLSGLGSAAQAAGRAMAVAFSGAAAFGVVGKLVEVQREFDVLNSSLKTVTGSSAAAERELAWLKTFAKETPFGLAQATQGFVKMKALGLDPTRAALTSFGNTASAMGKDLNQMIEAVADASTGEFERLKEFGIKAKKEGDNVSLTFQGVTTTIKNSASEITKYLEDIGNTSFGGAMEERAKTLDGTIAALGDTWDELFRTVSANNVGSLIFDSVTLANGALEDATTILRAMGGAAQDAGRDTGALSTIQSGIATVFETVAVLGANLKYVLVQIGNEIGGLAAQVAQAAQFNFSGVAAIRQAMVADAEAARKEIDATTARILNARKAQEEYARYATRNASAATDPRRIDLGASSAPTVATRAGARATKEALSEYDKLMQRLGVDLPKAAAAAEAAQHGYNKAQEEFIALAGSPVWAGFTNQQRAQVAALFENRIASEQAADAAKTLSKANADAAQAREKYLTSLASGVDKIKADTAAQIEATARLGLSKEAIADLDAAKLEMLATDLELQAIKALDRNLDEQTYSALKQQAEAYRELAAAKKAGAAKEMELDLVKANQEAAKKAEDEWQRTADDINRSLTDALLRGFESGKDFAKNMRDTVVNMFKTMVLRPVISAIVNPVAGAVTGMMGLSGAAQAGQGGAGGANTVQTGFSAINGSISRTIGDAFSKFAGSSVGQSLGLSNAQAIAGNNPSAYVPPGGELTATGQQMSQALGVVGDTLAGYAMGSMARSLISNGYSVGKGMDNFQKAGIAVGSALGGPVAGAIIGAGAGVFNQLFGRKLKDYGIQGTFGGTEGFDGEKYEFYKGGVFRSNKTKTSPLDQATTDGLTQQFRAIQLSTGLMAETLGLASGAVASFTKDIKLSFKGLTEEQIQEKMAAEFTAISDEMAGQVLGTMQTVTETIRTGLFKKPVTRVTYVQSEYAKANETASQTLTRLATSLTTVNSAFELLGVAMLDASLASGDMASRLIEQSGGGEAFAANLGTYYDNFYDQAEKTAYVTGQVTAALASVGLQMPATRDEFRALVESQIALGDSGTQAVAALLGVSGAFAQVADDIDAQFSELAKSAADVFAPLLESIRQARADVTGTRANMLKSDQAMTASQIAAAIGAAMVYAPNTAGVVGAQGGVTAAAQQVAQRQSALDAARAVASANQQSILAGLNKAVAPRTSAPGMTNDSLWEEIIGRNWQAHVARFGKGWNTRTTSDAERAANMNAMARQYADAKNADVYAAANWQSGQDAPAIAAAQSALAAAQAALAAAQQAEVQARADYAAQLNSFVLAASNSVGKLSGLREEVVRYYEEQAAAVQSMIATAQNLRNVVGSIRMGQLDSAQTAAQLGGSYASDYSMALATTGTTRAGYADSMASTLPTLAEAIKAEASTASDWRVQTGKLLAQATGVAGMLEADASGTDYQTTSLGLLDSIDTALAQLEGSTKSAEQVIAQAINDGTAAQLTGLRAVVAALRGDPIPAFATGGFHGGGLRLVGENGPELEVTGPSRIYSASQTAAMLSGGGNANAELVAELRALRADNQAQAAAMVNMQRELNKLMQRWDSQGMPEERSV